MKLVATAALFAAMTTPVAAAQLNIDVFDNGVLVGSTTSISGSTTLNVSDPNFDVLTLTAAGFPDLPRADLSSIALNVTSAGITTVHNIEIDVFQTGVNIKGVTASTFTANDLIGDPGPTVEKTFVGGTTSTLGALVKSATFPAGTVAGSVGPLFSGSLLATNDAQQYLIRFDAPDQSSNDTIQFSTAVPEPKTWVMLGLGFAFMSLTGARRRRHVNHIG